MKKKLGSFRVALTVMAALCLTLTACGQGGAAKQQASVTSTEGNAVSSDEASSLSSESAIHQRGNLDKWEAFRDLSGDTFDYSGTDVKGFEAKYVLGWNFDEPSYRKLYQRDKIGDCEILELHSKYYIHYSKEEPPSVICDYTEYSVDGMKKISGILVADKDGLGFYAYPDEDNHNFLFVCERNADSERAFTEQSSLDVGNGSKVRVQPIRFSIGTPEDSKLISRVSKLLSGTSANDASFLTSLTQPKYLKAEVQFSEVTVFAYSGSDGAGIKGTQANGYIADDKDIDIDRL